VAPPKSVSQETLRWRGMDSNFQYASAVNLIVAPASRQRRGLHRLGTESSPDSPLEEAGFEPSVPPRERDGSVQGFVASRCITG
jgi:hypothetical protein